VADWAGAVATTLAGGESAGGRGPDAITGRFSPCGYLFDETSTASGRATTTLVDAHATGIASGLLYANEDLAAFSLAGAEQLAASFRRAADGCPRLYDDIPVVGGAETTWEVEAVTLGPAGDEVVAVRIAKSDRGYFLVLVRKGRYVAFLRVLDTLAQSQTQSAAAVDAFAVRAAARLPPG
jgi:hypothetical protein